jgi:rSAM/selenodomain-associated transferase 2
MISVIIPALNEEDNVGRCIEGVLKEGCDCEIIIADGGSSDKTAEYAKRYPRVLFIQSQRGRGIQMNMAASSASGDILLFLHADTILETGWAAAILSVLEDNSISGGAFTLAIQSQLWKYRIVETWVKLRCRLCLLPYGDQAIFVRKSAFDISGGYKSIPLMEDVDLIEKLKKLGTIVVLNKKAITSERRWSKKGFIRTAAMNQLIMLLYRIGVNPDRLARIYYR